LSSDIADLDRERRRFQVTTGFASSDQRRAGIARGSSLSAISVDHRSV
jgi:hypothetical protein